jgi:hypothetical protein
MIESMSDYRAKVMADSKTEEGHRLTTLEITFPRFILAEINTHRMLCLAGDTELHFDLPRSAKDGKRHINKMSIEDLYRKWHFGTDHSRSKKGKFNVEILQDRDYDTKELASAIGLRSRNNIAAHCRNGGLAHKRDVDGRKLLINGHDFKEWYLNPPRVQYPLKHRLSQMRLRCANEDTKEIISTKIKDIWKSGQKEVFEVSLADGKKITCSKDHLFWTDRGWLSLQEATGLQWSPHNSLITWNKDSPKFLTNGNIAWKNKDWLQNCRNQKMSATEMAEISGATIGQVKGQLRKYNIRMEPWQYPKRSNTPWNKGKTYKNPKASHHNNNNLCGEKHHWWKGGITSERGLIGQWSRGVAKEIHASNDFQCVICSSGKSLVAHHIVPVVQDISLSMNKANLTTLCAPCHRRLHAQFLETQFAEMLKQKRAANFWHVHNNTRGEDWYQERAGHLLVVKPSSVIGIEYRGVQETYDIEVEGPYHNFVANGIIVHNSKNSASSRAIPLAKNVEKIFKSPFIPLDFSKNQPGMQSQEVLKGEAEVQARLAWIAARDHAAACAHTLGSVEVHKQHANRVLEPFNWQTALVSGTDWDNFFALRAHPDSQPEIQTIALLMREAMEESEPRLLKEDEWHLPLTLESERQAEPGQNWKAVSTGRCARVSYVTHEGKRDLSADVLLHDRLLSGGHLSPFEHIARPFNLAERRARDQLVEAIDGLDYIEEPYALQLKEQMQFAGNLRGFRSYRKEIPNEANYKKYSA